MSWGADGESSDRQSYDRGGPLLETYSREGSGLVAVPLRALGTHNVLLLAGDDGPRLRKRAQRAFDAILALEEKLSKFREDSEVSLVNRLGAQREVRVGPDLIALLDVARRAWDATGGAFDVTVGGLLEAWGLVEMSARRPDDAELERLLGRRGMDLVAVEAATGGVRLRRDGVAIDLGGIGKGYAIDRAVDVLREEGIEAGAIVSGRSTVVTWGQPPAGAEGGGWRVEVVHPVLEGEALCTLSAHPGAISTSGAYERWVRDGSRRIGHVIDPRTGRPSCAVEGVTVWTPSALLGDVLSTALFVLGEEAFDSTGKLERLVEALGEPGAPARATVLLAMPDTSSWGGVRVRYEALGAPGFAPPEGA